MKKAKIEMETLGKILLLTAFLIMFLLMFKGCQDQMKNVGTVGLNEYLCWLSKTMKADLTFLFPSACYVIDTEELKDKLGVSVLMRKCWWMYGQGDKDVSSSIKERAIRWLDVAGTCYMFTPKEDIEISEFIAYLRKHDKSGNTAKEDSKETTWGYIQKKSTEKTGICFDEKLEGKLEKKKRYFVIFYDDRSGIFDILGSTKGERDRIFISRDPEFGVNKAGILPYIKERFVSNLGCSDWEKESKIKQKRECEGYSERDCYDGHLDKCYPQFSIATGNYQSCKSCGDGFDCSYLPEKYCNLIKPCEKTCEMVGFGITKICTDKK